MGMYCTNATQKNHEQEYSLHKTIKNVIQTTKGRKNLNSTNMDIHEILRRFAPLNDNIIIIYLIPFLFPSKLSVGPYEPSDLAWHRFPQYVQ